jgi:hypothetical protein
MVRAVQILHYIGAFGYTFEHRPISPYRTEICKAMSGSERR